MIGENRPKEGKAAIVFPDFEREINEDPDEPKLVTGHVYDDQQIWQLRDLIEVKEARQAPTNDESHEVIGIYLPGQDATDINDTATAESAYNLDSYPLFLDHTHVVCSKIEAFDKHGGDSYNIAVEYDGTRSTEVQGDPGSETEIEIKPETGRVTVRITDQDGEPIRGVEIETKDKTVQTDKTGTAQLWGLGAGSHRLTISEGEYLASHIRYPHKTGEDAQPQELNVETVDLDRLFVRIESDESTPLDALQNKHIAIVGLGSGGGLIASYLAKSGVGKMTFIDDDLYETHNIVRHVCGEEALGREKVRAMKDYIKQRVPDVEINTVVDKFTFQTGPRHQPDTENRKQQFKDIFDDADMIISACAEANINRQLDRFVHEYDINAPVIYAGMFSNLKGGIMIRVDRSKNDPSYHTIYEKLEQGGRDSAGRDQHEADRRAQPETHPSGVTIQQETPRPSDPEPEINYDRDLEDEQSEPGLGLDVDNLSLFVTKFALSTLLEGTDHSLFELPNNIYMWANRDFTMQSFDPNSDPKAYKLDGLELMYIPEEWVPQNEQ